MARASRRTPAIRARRGDTLRFADVRPTGWREGRTSAHTVATRAYGRGGRPKSPHDRPWIMRARRVLLATLLALPAAASALVVLVVPPLSDVLPAGVRAALQPAAGAVFRIV